MKYQQMLSHDIGEQKTLKVLKCVTSITDVIKDNNPRKMIGFIKKSAKVLSSAFTALGIAIDIIFLFVTKGPSPMQLEMRESFKQVNRKLDQIKDQITDLSNHIDWKLKESTFQEKYALTIITLSEKLDYLVDYEPESEAFESKKREIIRYCDSHFRSHEFFNFLTNYDFFESFVSSSKNDRSKVLDKMKVVLYYVTQASKLDAACLHLKGEPQGRLDQEEKRWHEHFSELEQLMTKTDDQVKNAWHAQARSTDIPKYLRNNVRKSHRDFVIGLQ